MIEKVESRQGGFTLIEIIIAMLISSIVIAAIFAAFQSQQSTFLIQDQVAEMQQNIRVALEMVKKDVRSAGANPSSSSAGFTFVNGGNFDNGSGTATAVTTNASTIAFTADLDEDGVLDRAVQDVNGDGFTDMSEMEQIAYRLNGTDLQRYSTVTGVIIWQTIAENIEAIEFYYTLEDGTQTLTPSAADLLQIKSVQISILARAGDPDDKFTNTQTYTPASGTAWDLNGAAVGNAPDDNFRRRLLITTVQCRNMGI